MPLFYVAVQKILLSVNTFQRFSGQDEVSNVIYKKDSCSVFRINKKAKT